jgi:hypothetical protein
VQFQHHHLRLGLVPLPSKPRVVGNRNKPGVLFPRHKSSEAQCRNNPNVDCRDNKPSNFNEVPRHSKPYRDNAVLRHNKPSAALTLRPVSVSLAAELPVSAIPIVRSALFLAVVDLKQDLPVVLNKPIQAAQHPIKAADMADHFALPVSIGVNKL